MFNGAFCKMKMTLLDRLSNTQADEDEDDSTPCFKDTVAGQFLAVRTTATSRTFSLL